MHDTAEKLKFVFNGRLGSQFPILNGFLNFP